MNPSLSSLQIKPTVSKSFASKKSIGGNCHENWTLLRLLPLMISHIIPEDDKTWGILLDLKEIVEFLASGHFSEETLTYLECKISDHRCLLKEVFPDFHLLPKHHFLEHYPWLISGPLDLKLSTAFLKGWCMILTISGTSCSLYQQNTSLL